MNKKLILLSIVFILFFSLVTKSELNFNFINLVDTEQINKVEISEETDNSEHIQLATIKDIFALSVIYKLATPGSIETNAHTLLSEINLSNELNHSPPISIS